MIYETREMRDLSRIEDFVKAFDDLCNLEKKNGTFEDNFHSRRRHFAYADIKNSRIRDVSERYVFTRIAILTRIIEQKEATARSLLIFESAGTTKNGDRF
jgi:hypothetical protein